jgi:hypothetical protein
MGFPFKKGDDPLDPTSFEYVSAKDLLFSVKVNKTETPFTKQSVSDTYNQKADDKYDFMYTWPVSFQPKEKRVVECSYNVQWGDDLGLNGSFTYIAKTGARWHGTLDSADFLIELGERTYRDYKSGDYNFKITPDGYKVNGKTIEWHYTNWKPENDFTITYDRIPRDEDAAIVESVIGRFDFKKTYDGDKRYYTIEDIESHRTDPNGYFAKFYIKVLRNEIYARHGRIFKSVNLQRVFAGRDWYKQDPSFTEKMLNKYERANIDYIYNYEKKKGWQ